MADPTLIGTVSGLTTARWGTTGVGTDSRGIVYSCRHRKDGEEKKVKNPSGGTIAHLFFDSRDEVELEILALDAASLPSRGDTLALTGDDLTLSAVVTSCEERWQNEDFVFFTISAVKHAGVTLA